METKKCSTKSKWGCGKVKPLSDFPTKGGVRLSYLCRECTKARNKAYREENADSLREYDRKRGGTPERREQARRYRKKAGESLLVRKRAYYHKNKEQENARSKRWREANKEHVSARGKAYYEANKEELNRKCREYRQKNLEKLRAYDRDRALDPDRAAYNAEKSRKYREENREECCKYCSDWRIKKRAEEHEQALLSLGITNGGNDGKEEV